MSRSNSYTDEIRELSNFDLNKLIAIWEKQPKEKIIASLWELEKREALDQDGRDLLSQLHSSRIINININTEKVSGPLPTGPFMDPNISNDPSLPKLYSRYAIRVFAVVFSTFFGGILLAINMYRLKKKDQIFPIILFSFGFAYLTVYISSKVPDKMTLITLVMNLIGLVLLEELFWNKQIGKEFKFQRQSILPALFIGIIISLFLLAGMASMGVTV